MSVPKPNSPAALNAAILADARRECDDITRQARKEAETLIASAEAEAETFLREKRESAQADAARQTEMTLATGAVEVEQMRAARIESILENIRGEARRRLLDRECDRETVVALASEAISQMSGTDFNLRMSPANQAVSGEMLSEEIGQRVGRASLNVLVSSDPAMTDSGVLVQDVEGLRLWDNRLLSRLERMWPELRRQIALRTSLIEQPGASGFAFEEAVRDSLDSRQRPGKRQPAAAFPSRASDAKPVEDCRSPKPAGVRNNPEIGDA